MTYGVSAAGFTSKPFTQILADYQAAILAGISPTLDLSPTQPEGQLIGILANADSNIWQLIQSVYNVLNPRNAQGAAADNVGDLRGIPRLGASFTQVICNLTISAANAPYAPGTLVANVQGVPGLTFSNQFAVTAAMISGGVAQGITFQATTIGPTATVNPGTLTAITAPVTGWSAITNPIAQSQLGQAAELDNAYLVRQNLQLASQGSCNPPATVAALYTLLASVYPNGGGGPYSVSYYQNTTNQTITQGTIVLPPHTYAVVFYDPVGTTTPAQIAATIWANGPAGIQSIGASSGIVSDPYLGSQAVNWTTPTGLRLYVNATISLYPGQVWSVVMPAVQAALAAAAIAPTPVSGGQPVGQLRPGAPVIGGQLEAVIMGVPGVANVQALTFGFAPSPVNTAPLSVSPTNVATLASGDVALIQGTYP